MNKEELDYGVIDDFLPQKEFEIFQSVIMKPSNISNENTVGWEFQSTVTGNDNPNDWKYFYMMHMIYIHSFVFSPILYEKVTPILIELDINKYLPRKNMQNPNTGLLRLEEHLISSGMEDEIIQISAKTGKGISKVFSAIINLVPLPREEETDKTRALIFDSYFDQFRGVVVYVRVFDGYIEKGMTANYFQKNGEHEILEVGILKLDKIPIYDIINKISNTADHIFIKVHNNFDKNKFDSELDSFIDEAIFDEKKINSN